MTECIQETFSFTAHFSRRVLLNTLGPKKTPLQSSWGTPRVPTLDVYSHVLPHMQSEAAVRVAASLGMGGCE